MEVTVDNDDKGTGSLYVWRMHDASLVLAIFKSHFRLCLLFFLKCTSFGGHQ